MEACYMVSYFVSNNSDSDVADASNRPPDPYLIVNPDFPDTAFKVVLSVKFA